MCVRSSASGGLVGVAEGKVGVTVGEGVSVAVDVDVTVGAGVGETDGAGVGSWGDARHAVSATDALSARQPVTTVIRFE
jgi:hypothetical protein